MQMVMRKILSFGSLLTLLLLSAQAFAQGDPVIYNVNAANNGSVNDIESGTAFVRDDDSQGSSRNPTPGIDYSLTIKSSCGDNTRLCFRITELSVSCLDTVYIYEGAGTTGPLLLKFNSFTGNVTEGQVFFIPPTNTNGMITVRFVTDPLTNSDRTNLDCFRNNGGIGRGFELRFECGIPCEDGYPVIDSMFYRTRNGVVYDSSYLRDVFIPDTVWKNTEDHSEGYVRIDTISFTGAHLCIGDGVVFTAHGEYSNYNYGYYTPSDATSHFTWSMGYENDTIAGVGVTRVEYDNYQSTGCYDVALTMVDAFGCKSDVYTSIRVRTSLNPLKTIFTIGDICNNTERLVSMGYDGDNATITLRRIENSESVSKVNEVRTFIPDGCDCGTPSYYEAPVDFTEFPNNRKVRSASDICSICINMEHSYVGDFYLTLVCPTGQEAILKFGSPVISNCTYPNPQTTTEPGGARGGGEVMGFPLDAQYVSGSGWDNSPKCDSAQNPYGIGLDYCFSRDAAYTLVTGQNAGSVWSSAVPHPAGNFYISQTGNTVNLPVVFPPVPAGFANAGVTPVASGNTITTKKPSDKENKTDYYLPYATFDELIGCPLNGTWKVRVYDTFGQDNGWIFNWSLDICNVTQDNDCKYEVGIDSLVWRPTPGHDDYDLGRYRGLVVRHETPTISYISSPDTAGYFPIDVYIYDEFGCVWDTSTSITTYWSPEPNLGPDTSLCGVATMTLDARDRHSELPTENYTYLWNPFGQETPTIETSDDGENLGDATYVVQVKNTRRNTVCTTRDTIFIRQRKQPYPGFEPVPFSLEGCAPYTLTFNNISSNADRHLWDFGDGITSEFASPTHTYAEGVYTLKYYAFSDDGCVDSSISTHGVVVFPTPKAGFVWDPVYPSVLNPVVRFTNTTEPHTGSSQYRWEMQYDRNNPLSVHTLTDRNPTFDYSTYATDGLSGNYAVRLIAYTENLSPRGHLIQCRDTSENSILIVNDFLQFPNVVTPNGDGINDRFVIINLLDGIGYPINQLDIYNRWGTRVYHKENISSDEDFWDPADLPAGTYFYRFSAKGYSGNIEHNGAIEVVK